MKYPIRSMVVAPKGYYLLEADLSQAEAWVVAYKANERLMKDALMFGDIHSQTARALFDLNNNENPTKDQRFLGKKFNHACNYQMGAIRAAETINKESDKPPFITVTIAEAKILHKKWNEYYSLRFWWAEIEEKVRRDRVLTTIYQRKRTFYGPVGDHLFKEATAFEPQSTIADHMLGAVQPEVGIDGGIRHIYHKIVGPSKGKIRITNTSHDSIIMEVPIDQITDQGRMVRDYLKRPMIINGEEFTVPVDIKFGERWGELEEMKL